jgi:decaprenylphospho-beta-D-erythro-pentofuranosid-2-ulose 2-reductase
VRNALGAVQSVLVLGGASDIGKAIAERLVRDDCRAVVLAGRRPEAMAPVADELRTAGAEVAVSAWDALDIGSHADAVKAAWEAMPATGAVTGSDDALGAGAVAGAEEPRGNDVDCVVLAAGVLGEQAHFENDPQAAAEAVTANYTGAVSTLLHVAQRLRQQGHGTIVVLSSVAGERARRSNFVYGSSKAGLDAFAQGLGDALVGSGVRVIVVRPGYVHTSMTEGKEPAPLATTADKVADAVAGALADGREVVWVPGTFRYLITVFRHLPRPIWRKVSANR